MFASSPLLSFLSRQTWRLTAALALSASALLSGCGSGSTFEPLQPSRIAVFGDGLADLGQTGARFTINDGSADSIWVETVATNYGLTLTAAVSGGLGYAQGGARVTATGAAPSVEQQISQFLASNTIGSKDLLIVDAGLSDLAALTQDRITQANGINSDAAFYSAATAAGRAVAGQVRRLVSAGGKHVVVANAYNLSQSPYAVTNAVGSVVSAAVRNYNDALKIALADLGNNVLLLEAEGYYSAVFLDPSIFLGANAISNAAICTSASITTCTPSTLIAGADPALYLFASDRYFTPTAQRLFGGDALSKIRNRW